MLVGLNNLIVNLIAFFILDKANRHQFRNKYKKRTKFRKLRDDFIMVKSELRDIRKQIDTRFNSYINTFYNFDDVKLNNPDLKMVKNANSILLFEFKKICDEHDVEFWIDWGVLLGAYRHHGYVPWDDDIDVGITRDNFEKLKKVIKNHDEFILSYIYLLYNATTHARFYYAEYKDVRALHLDVYIYDFFDAENKNYLKSHINKNRALLIKQLKAISIYHDLPWNKLIVLELDDQTALMLNDIFNDFYRCCNFKSNGNYLSTTTFGVRELYIHDKDSVYPFGELEFEGDIYPTPNNVDDYLRVRYRNYMLFPNDTGKQNHVSFVSFEDMSAIRQFIEKYKKQ